MRAGVVHPNKKVAVLVLALAAGFSTESRPQQQAAQASAALGPASRPAAIGLPPPWAYGFTSPPTSIAAPSSPAASSNTAPVASAAAAAKPADPTLRSLPGTTLHFTRAQISDRFGPADWYPQDHPVMPPVVAHGRAPKVLACALCHYPNGRGRPENAALAGLPEAYILEQLEHLRRDERHTADPRKTNTALMVQTAKGMTEEEMRAAAHYFSALKFPRWIRVVETDTVPKTEPAGGMFLAIANGGREPIGRRIVETPEDRVAVEELRNPHIGFVAYVPRGSIRRGEAIVTRGGGKTPLPCTTCHGPDLKGMLNIPPIAGRSPSYIAREMFDIRAGTRFGTGVDLMKPIVANLDDDDLLDIAAYVASRSP